MPDYYTSTSTEGLRFPYSGVIVGKLAEALRLKAALREDFQAVSYKTVQRYFKGDRIEPESVRLILEELVTTLVPQELLVGEGYIEPVPLDRLVSSAFNRYARQWDLMAAQANTHMFEVMNPRDLYMPVLRLLALDLGIRVGGWAAIQYLRGEPVDVENVVAETDRLRLFIERRRERLKLTVEALAESVGVSAQALEAWRSGASLPTSDNIEALGQALSDEDIGRAEAEFRLRIVVAVSHLFSGLKALIGQERLDDLRRGAWATASQVVDSYHQILTARPNSDAPLALLARWDEMVQMQRKDFLQGVVWELPVHGAHSPGGSAMASYLAEQAAARPDVVADLQVLPGDWSPRILYWLRELAVPPEAGDRLAADWARDRGVALELAKTLVAKSVEAVIRLGDPFSQPLAEAIPVPIPSTAEQKATRRQAHAEASMSAGDFVGAVEQFRQQVRHQPQDPMAHFGLGCALWQLGQAERDLGQMEEGLTEVRIAVGLDPDFANARNEIAIILSNLRRHEEAEVAFAEAEPFFDEHSHFWLSRGNNYLALRRMEEARGAFQKVTELSGEHVEAKRRLAAVLMVLGEKGKARKLGKQVHHVTGSDPTEDPERSLDPWAGVDWPPNSLGSEGTE